MQILLKLLLIRRLILIVVRVQHVREVPLELQAPQREQITLPVFFGYQDVRVDGEEEFLAVVTVYNNFVDDG